jgi:hypothetical protein
MTAFLIGIDPPSEVKRDIYRLKNRVIEACGHQQQVDEPPHCTFVVNNFTSLEDVDRALRKTVRNSSPFDVNMSGVAYFPPEQSGTYMIHAGIGRSKELQNLQIKVVSETAGFRNGCLLREYLEKNVPKYRYTKTELANIKNLGYPYVGGNWSPHISIAILDPKAFEKIGKELIGTKLDYRFPLENVTLFAYDNKWKPFRNYKLGD